MTSLEPRSPVTGWASGGGGAPAPHATTHEPGQPDALAGYLPASARGTASGVGSLTTAGRQPTTEAPIVKHQIRLGNVTSTVTSDAASGAGNLINLNLNGNITVGAPINGVDRQEIEHHMVAVGADRTVTFTGGYVLAGPSTLGPYTVPRGRVLVARSVYVGNRATAADAAAPAWALLSVDITDAVTPPAPHTHPTLALPEQASVPAAVADVEQLFAVDVDGITSFRVVSPTGLVTDIQRDSSFIARNETGATIPRGTPVYLAGVSAATFGLPAARLPLIAAARANAVTTLPCIGVTMQAIASGASGRVMQSGMLTGLDTSAFSEGARLWVSAATAGALAATAPSDLIQRVAFVVRSSATDGQLLVDLRAMHAATEGTLVPPGGAAGAVLAKVDATNWAAVWKLLTASDVGAAPTGHDHLDAVSTRTASYTLTGTDDVVVFSTASAALTATLPTAVGRAGQVFTVKKVGANPLTIATTSSQTIDGVTTETISMSYGFRTVISDGTNWHVIGGRVDPVIVNLADTVAAGTLTINAAAGTIYRGRLTGSTATLAAPTNPIDGDVVNVELYPTVACTLTLAAAIIETGGLPASFALPVGKTWYGAMRYRAATNPVTVAAGWRLLAASVEN